MADERSAVNPRGPVPRPRVRRPPAPVGTPKRLSELDHHARRLAVLRAATYTIGTWILLGVVYFALPGRGFGGVRELARLTVSLILVAVVFVWQMRRVARSVMPEVQAVQALGMVIPLFLIVFATLYLSIGNGESGSFSESLDHTSSLYLTITVFSTVGFGDITPKTDPARIAVSIQMLLDLVIIGFAVRAIFGVAKSTFESASDDE